MNVTELAEYNVIPGSIVVIATGTVNATAKAANLAASGFVVVTYMGRDYYLNGFTPAPAPTSLFRH